MALAVSKQFVEAMGGTIGVESAPGVGATFWVELPRLAAPVVEDERAETFSTFAPEPVEDVFRQTDMAATVTEAASATRTLLYVEDNAANRDLVAHLFAVFRPDLRLLLPHDAEEGLAVAHRLPGTDFILLDRNLSGLSGEVALTRLRSDPRTAFIPWSSSAATPPPAPPNAIWPPEFVPI